MDGCDDSSPFCVCVEMKVDAASAIFFPPYNWFIYGFQCECDTEILPADVYGIYGTSRQDTISSCTTCAQMEQQLKCQI